MSAKKSPLVRPDFVTNPTPARAAPVPPDLLLVCLQDPFDAVGDSSTLVRAVVPAASGNPGHQWMLESVLEMHPPRCFRGWATRGSFTLDLSVTATALPATGTWGGTATTLSGSGNCRIIVMRDADDKVHFSLASDARHAPEMPMPVPDEQRFLNADIAFEANGKNGVSAGAVAVMRQSGGRGVGARLARADPSPDLLRRMLDFRGPFGVFAMAAVFEVPNQDLLSRAVRSRIPLFPPR